MSGRQSRERRKSPTDHAIRLRAIELVVEMSQQRRSQQRALVNRARRGVERVGEMIVSHAQ